MPAVQQALPPELQKFIRRSSAVFQTDEGDWEVKVEMPPGFLARQMPPGAVLVARNGLGDHLFLLPAPGQPDALSSQLHVFWHEGASAELFKHSLSELTDPPPPAPSSVRPVLYADGVTRVLPGDEVIYKGWFFKRRGRVTYVPGISRKHGEMEHHGLTWVGISREKGGSVGCVVDPNTSRLRRNVVFVQRSSRTDDAITPETAFD